MDITRTQDPKDDATSAVSSVQPLATTITFKSLPGVVGTTWASRRPSTRPSLCAGMMMVVTPKEYGRKWQQRAEREALQNTLSCGPEECCPRFSIFVKICRTRVPAVTAVRARAILGNVPRWLVGISTSWRAIGLSLDSK